MSAIPFATKKNLRDAEVKMKEHLEDIKNALNGRQVEFVIEQDLAAIHGLAQSLGFPGDWPFIVYDMSVAEIAKAIRLAANHENPRLKASFFDTFTGNKIIFRIPSLNNPDGEASVKYSFENGNMVCNRGSEFNCNIDEIGWFYHIECALKPNFNVSAATSAADVEKLWIEAVNDIARRQAFDKTLQEPLEQLLKKGAKVDLPKFGESGRLSPAAFLLNKWQGESNLQCMDFLVDHGADVYALIEVSVHRGRTLLMRLLARKGVDVNHQDVNGKTFLHYAAEQFEDPRLITKVRTTGRHVRTEEVWVNPAGETLAYKSDAMYAFYDSFFDGLKNIPGIDVNVQDKNGRTALELARHVNNIWILPGLETFHNSRLSQVPAKSNTSQPVAGAVKKMPIRKPQSPAVAKFNNNQATSTSAAPKLPKELLSLLDVMYQTIKQSASNTSDLEREYQRFTAIFNVNK